MQIEFKTIDNSNITDLFRLLLVENSHKKLQQETMIEATTTYQNKYSTRNTDEMK